MIGMAVLVGQTRFEDKTIDESTQGVVLQGLFFSVEKLLAGLKGNDQLQSVVSEEVRKLEALQDILSQHKHLDGKSPPKWPSAETPPTRTNLQKISALL